MSVRRRKTNLFLYVLFLMLLASFAFYPNEAKATGTGATATEIVYNDTGQTVSEPGRLESFWLNVSVSGGTYSEPYSILYLKRDEFDRPDVNQFRSNTIKSATLTNDATYWKVKIVYNVLSPGPRIGNPFRISMINGKFANGETATIETRLFTKDGVELANSSKQITAQTYVMGINSNDDGTIRGWTKGWSDTYVQVTDDQTDATHTHLKNGFTDTWYSYAQNGKKHVNDTEVTGYNYGVDRRKKRTVLSLLPGMIWDPSLPDNSDWTYDPVNHTITKDTITNPGGVSYMLKFTIKHDGTQTVNENSYTYVFIPQTNYLVNDDGTVDLSTERKSNVYKSYKYTQKLYLTKRNVFPETNVNGQLKAYSSGDLYTNLGDNDGKDKWLINVSQYWGAGNVTGSTTSFRSIKDTPHENVDFQGYGLRVFESMFDAANLAKLSHNKLIGINDDNTEELIAANIPYTAVNNTDEYYKWNTENTITPKHYKSIRLDFDDDITISGYGEYAVGLFVESKLTAPVVAAIQNRINTTNNIYTVYNTGEALSSSGTSLRSQLVRRHYGKNYAKIGLLPHSQNVNGNPNVTNVQLGDNVLYHVYTNYNSYLNADRTVDNAKLIFLVDPELEFSTALHHSYQAMYRFTLDTTPQRIDDYKGTGKTAYVFDLNNFTLPKAPGIFGGVDRMYYTFKPTTALSEGEHTVESFLSWDNNSTDASGTDSNTVYSSTVDNAQRGISSLDKYDANNNGNRNDRLSYLSFKFNFVPPRAVILTKKQKLATDTAYKSIIKAEKGDIVEYKLSAWNNSIDNASAVNIMDILPYANDKAIVKDDSGNYVSRGSKMYPVLQGPVSAPSGYSVYYSTDPPAGTIEGNVGANWVPASAVTDWSSVTMFKAVMNTSYRLTPGNTDDFTYSVKIPETKELDADASANNSVASWYGNNLTGASESTVSKVGINKYLISGKVYYDVDENNEFNTGDFVGANKPVRLVKMENGTPTVVDTVITDANGNYTFKNKISNAGDYKVYIETFPGDTIRPLNPSTVTKIGNEFSSYEVLPSKLKENENPVPNMHWAVVDVSLTRTDNTKIENLGLKTVYSNLIVKHIKREDNTELSPTTTVRMPRWTPYTTSPVTDTYYEAETPLPTNKDGEYGDNDTTVTYYYVRKNAGDVTVHHYKENTTTELATTVVLPGANKFGLNYTTNEESITNYELVAQPTNKNGTYTLQSQTVDYFYRRKNAGNIIVKYLETGTNNPVHAQKVLDGTKKLGLNYSESPENITYYDLDTTNLPTNDSGVYTAAPITITYYYKRQNAGDVTATYVDVDTNTALHTPEVQNGSGKLGLAYDTDVKSFTNYTLMAVPTNKSGNFDTANILVEYKYRRNDAGKVTATYVDADTGATLHAAIEQDGSRKLGLPYDTDQKSFVNYDLIAVPSNKSGNFGTAQILVEYKYRRQNAGDVTATYVDVDTNTALNAPEVQSGARKLGLPYDTDQKSFTNYDLTAVPSNKSGNFGNTSVLVEYKYRRKNAGNVRVRHLDAITNAPLAAEEFLDGSRKLGLNYTTQAKSSTDLPNYELFGGIPANANGVYTAGSDIIVTYLYQRETAGNVIATYKDEADGHELHPLVGQSGVGMLGVAYDTEAKTFDNYDLISIPANKSGTFSHSNVLVEYVYRRKDAGSVKVNHIEAGTGEVLHSPSVLDGSRKLGLAYTTNSENINFYDLVGVPANANGIFTVGEQVVNYEYTRKNAGDVVVRHLSKYDGSELIQREVLDGSGKLGLTYTTNAADIDYFEIDTIPSNKDGVYTTLPQTVDYIYRRKNAGSVKAVYVDEEGNELANSEVLSGVENAGLPYNTVAKSITHYELVSMPNNASGVFSENEQTVTYVYRRKNAGSVKVFYIDGDSGVNLAEPKILDGNKKLGLAYTTEPENIEFHDLISMPANKDGVFTDEEQTVTYVYGRKNAGNVTIHYVNTAHLKIRNDDILDGSKKLGLPFTTSAAEIAGYHFTMVEGVNFGILGLPDQSVNDGIFKEGAQEITYVYRKDPSVVITPGEPVPATPSNIADPRDWNSDFIIRPGIATSSIATRSNTSRGGSSSDSIVRPAKAIKLIDNATIDKRDENPTNQNSVTQEPKKKANMVVPQDENKAKKLPVPKTADKNKTYIYLIMLIISLAALIRFRKKM